MLSPPLLLLYSITPPSIVLSITSLSLVWLRCQAVAMLSGRVQVEDSERKIERQQLVGGDKVETHTTAHAHPHQLFISWPEQIHIYRFPEQQTARRSAQKFWITCQASHQHLYRTSYIYDKEHQGQRNHSRMWNTLARLRAQSILLNTHSQAQTGALRSPELLLVLLLNPATDEWVFNENSYGATVMIPHSRKRGGREGGRHPLEIGQEWD